ncbi:MAG: hypothetical protein COV67_00705 [Nitrospinae bacterium CG11_big_fil_rev_8_21_14_0_20_56_8]|nr:MAG: hypothetical protein COV67_00705 [Nitrospinae bacterium CG11_big_fil_rev_8_21_14_0_20_56_8]
MRSRAFIIMACIVACWLVLPATARADEAKDLLDDGVQANIGKHYDRAVEAFRKSIELNPAVADAHLQLGFALQHLKHFTEAVQAYRDGIALNPSHPFVGQAWYNMGVSLDQLGEGEDAIAAIKKSIQAYTDHMDYSSVFRAGLFLRDLSERYHEPGER